MANASFRGVVGTALVAAFIDGMKRSPSTTSAVMLGIGAGFAGDSAARSTYQKLLHDKYIQGTQGFADGSTYQTLRSNTYDIIDDFLPSVAAYVKEDITTAVHAVLLGLFMHSNVDLIQASEYLGYTQQYTAKFAHDISPYTYINNELIHPFTPDVLSSLLSQGFEQTVEDITQSSKPIEAPLVNYNWYDANQIFAGPSLQKMKDVEHQYYYVSGKLKYENPMGEFPDCIEDDIQISVGTGEFRRDINTKFIRNHPCRDRQSYIGPPQNVVFNRLFCDAPPAVGYFTNDVKNAYYAFEQNILDRRDYEANARQLFSFVTGTDGAFIPRQNGAVFIDDNGPYDLNNEYGYFAQGNNLECIPFPIRMRIGDNLPRYFGTRVQEGEAYVCDTGASYSMPFTGFKYVELQRNDSAIPATATYWKFNPVTVKDRLKTRMLALNPYPYLSREVRVDDITLLETYDTRNNAEYVGPPQLNGFNTIPTFAFYQTFDNPTFGTFPTITMFPCVSYDEMNFSGNAVRTYDISPTSVVDVYSSVHSSYIRPARLTFSSTIYSESLGSDNVAKQVFGMGDSFTGQYTVQQINKWNAGILFSGANLIKDGEIVNSAEVLQAYDQYILGSRYQDIRYINGLSRSGSSEPDFSASVNQIYAQDVSGNLIPYYYFDGRGLPIGEDFDGFLTGVWGATFAPMPTSLRTDPTVSRTYKTQPVENYSPRFSAGPYSVETRKFLYPNASQATYKCVGKLNGFPRKVHFDLEVREETIREIFAQQSTRINGTISTVSYINVIRPDVDEMPNLTRYQQIMPNMFEASIHPEYYDFNQWPVNMIYLWPGHGYVDVNTETGFYSTKSIPNLVDNNWAPLHSGYVVSGRNNYDYSNAYPLTLNDIDNDVEEEEDIIGPLFSHGVRITGNRFQEHLWKTGYGANDYFVFYSQGQSNPALYHAYAAYKSYVSMVYTPPIYDVTSGSKIVSSGLREAFPVIKDLDGTLMYPFSGGESTISSGTDPLFYELVGSRSGDSEAARDGGNHSRGIGGDQWLTLSFYGHEHSAGSDNRFDYGIANYQCEAGGGYRYRYPLLDDRLLLFCSAITGTNVFAKSMRFTPYFAANNSTSHFSAGVITLNGNIDGTGVNINATGDTNGFVHLNLGAYFPLKATGNIVVSGIWPTPRSWTVTGYEDIDTPLYGWSEEQPRWYYYSGFKLGPFDRDVEIGVCSGNEIIASTDLYVGTKRVCRYYEDAPCKYDAMRDQRAFTTISPSGESKRFRILDIIPMGQTVNFNVHVFSGYSQIGLPPYDEPLGLVGLSGNKNVLSIRAHKPLVSTFYNRKIHSGEEGWLVGQMYANNGMERKYSLPHSSSEFEGLENTTTFTVYGPTGTLYPQPDIDFTGYGVTDRFGNLTYPPYATVQQYWQDQAIYHDRVVDFYLWREGSRISFKIKNVLIEYDDLPYETYQTITPSGLCKIEGEFGYLAQADNSIFSEGLLLENRTAIDPLAVLYNPIYLSDVLSRFSFINVPTGKSSQPIIPAPSIMKQRLFVSGITSDQEYRLLESSSPLYYNRMNWPALSDLETLNPGETLERLPSDDGSIFPLSQLSFSASRGQSLANGGLNPNINKTFDVMAIFQVYDSVACDATLNSGECVNSSHGKLTRLDNTNINSVLAPEGSSLAQIRAGLT